MGNRKIPGYQADDYVEGNRMKREWKDMGLIEWKK